MIEQVSNEQLLSVHIHPSELLAWERWVRKDWNATSLKYIFALKHTDGFKVHYHFENWKNQQTFEIIVTLGATESLPSLKLFENEARLHELIIQNKFKINFRSSLPDSIFIYQDFNEKVILPPKPIINTNPNLLQKPFEGQDDVWESYRPGEPCSMDKVYWYGRYRDDCLIDAKIHLGISFNSHQSIMGKSIFKLFNYFEMISPFGGYQLTLFSALENKIGIEISAKSQALRMLSLELDRILSHLQVLTRYLDFKKSDQHKVLLKIYNYLKQLKVSWTQSDINTSPLILGGVVRDFPEELFLDFKTKLDFFKDYFKFFINSFSQHLENQSSKLDVMSVSSEEALLWGLRGPSLRATGVNYDLRKIKPLYFYEDISFEIPAGIFGTYYDRFLVRIFEVIESFQIIQQVMSHLPPGEINNQFDLFTWQDALEAKGEFVLSNSYEGAEGEVGFNLMVDEKANVQAFQLLSPSVRHLHAFKLLNRGVNKDEIKPSILSTNLNMNEFFGE